MRAFDRPVGVVGQGAGLRTAVRGGLVFQGSDKQPRGVQRLEQVMAGGGQEPGL